MVNKKIRIAVAESGVRLWQVAERLGITDCSLSRKLRKELPQEERDKILSVIQELSREAG